MIESNSTDHSGWLGVCQAVFFCMVIYGPSKNGSFKIYEIAAAVVLSACLSVFTFLPVSPCLLACLSAFLFASLSSHICLLQMMRVVSSCIDYSVDEKAEAGLMSVCPAPFDLCPT